MMLLMFALVLVTDKDGHVFVFALLVYCLPLLSSFFLFMTIRMTKAETLGRVDNLEFRADNSGNSNNNNEIWVVADK